MQCTLTLAPGGFTITLPEGHAITLPFSLVGLRFLESMLTSRAMQHNPKIATPGLPSQWEVNLAVAKHFERAAAAFPIDLTDLEL